MLVNLEEIQVFKTLILPKIAFVANLHSSVGSASFEVKRHFLVVLVYISSILHYDYINRLEELRFQSKYTVYSSQQRTFIDAEMLD
jgi:hypothetical protein